MNRAATIAIPLAAIAGCSSHSDPLAKTSTSTTAQAAQQSFGTVVELRDAAVSAGLPCSSWNQTNIVKFGAESGNCSESDVLVTYATDSDKAEAISTKKALDADMATSNIGNGPTPMLVGKNWTILSKSAPELQKKMGGALVTSSAD